MIRLAYIRQLHITKNIHNKLSKNKAIVTRANKGKTTVFMYEHEYHKKVRAFLSENNIEPIPTDPTNKYQTHITRKLKQCDLIFLKKQHTHITQKNPAPPTLKAQLKLHKPNIPIRPVVNNREAPSYKIAKKLNILKQHLNLGNSVENSTTLANDLSKITLKVSYRLITLDIKDLYVNIPIQETLQTARSQLLKNNNRTLTDQLCSLLEATLNQNYFTYQNQIYRPTKGVAMGSLISGLSRNTPTITRTHAHQTPTRHKTHHIIYKTRRRHPHNLRRSADQPRHHHTLRQLHQQQHRT